MQLYNTLSNIERAELLQKAGKDRLTISFYKYSKISNTEELRNHLFLFWNSIDVLGRELFNLRVKRVNFIILIFQFYFVSSFFFF